MSGRKNTSRANLNATSLEERLTKWKEHFKNLSETPLNHRQTYKKIMNGLICVKLDQFTEEELDAVLKKIKSRKVRLGEPLHLDVRKAKKKKKKKN